ncbi:MAG TPA: DUF2007 domain-containing protein [Bryobacteraceae bacterium]|nr:DUF2007 domain-containing protein [Bryobacteraceae bacterium]HOL72838.1 DUF2007 domain-containing protein [Bryobacteraceae bacterium]HOQ46392.1 DUF2007 domain-containing protein [Bryobacteraceae bacterium]HPQ15087.1 DUF2007 domain-containing protein [Bryobacteraceae bacterium]HPU72171.1 DUF2007 domain-containing protein [Bryobacteraceae bacterium]
MSGSLVTVETFLIAHEAEMARGYLEAHGIDVFLADREMSRIHVSPLIGGVKLQVRAEDQERARELLAKIRRDAGGDEGDEVDR